ncbi:hypothetical protein CYMTET_23248 [Cymbomonas tetramitiformis]|uniref:Uncharacterized protein n=1 Tax=Cymbomonas tetramitiformis TaxID=36881 RepID=A0AAE0L1A6_9CHLO|nr:hypothetical protein CYMTET_23248 [Cymbomonas tetramitiformis]
MNDATPLPFTSDIENIIKRARIQVLANLWTRSPETPRDPSEASEHHSLLCTDPRVISLKAFYDLPQCGPCKKRPSSETCLFQNLHAELMQYESIRTTTVNFTHGDVARPLIVMNDIWTGVDALLNFEKTGDDLQPQTQQQAELLVRRLIPDDLRMSDDIVGNTTLKDALSRLLSEPPSAGEPSAGEPIDDQFLRALKASIIQLASNLARGISTDTQLEELGGLNFSSDMLIMPSRYDDEDPAINSNTTFKLPSAIENMASHPDDQEMLPVSSPDDREMLPSSPSQEPPGDRETTTPPTLARRPSLWTLRDSVMVTCFRAKSNKERWDWTPLSNLNIALNDVWTVEKQAELAESTAQPRPILSLADIVDPNKKHQTYTLRSDFYNFTSTVVYNSELMAQFAALKFPQEDSRISNMNWQNSDPEKAAEKYCIQQFRQRRFDQTIDFLKKLANVVLELRESVDPISVKRPVYQMDLKCDNVAVFFEKYPESAHDGSVCTDHASFWTYAVTCLEFLDKQVNKGTSWMHTEDLIDESSSSSSSTKKKYQTVASYFHSHGVTARGQAEVGRRRAKAAKNTRSDNIGRRHLTSSAGFWNNEITTLKKLYAWFIDEYEFGKNCEIPFVTPMMEFLEELKASEKPRSVDEMYRSLAQEYAS